MTNLPLYWDDKIAASVLDYSVDFGSLLGAGETIAGVTFVSMQTSALPNNVGDLLVTPATPPIAGSICSFFASNGLAGRTYIVTATAQSSALKSYVIERYLRVVS